MDTMTFTVGFPGGARVDSRFEAHVIQTDLPPASGGQDSAPTPFVAFLASIGTCAGVYVLGFCQKRQLPTEGISIRQTVSLNPATGMAEKIDLDIHIPATFPESHRAALVRAAEKCKVKKHLEHPPAIETRAVID